MTELCRIALAGASGKMGQAIARLAQGDARIVLHEVASRDAATLFNGADVVIDFSRPELTATLAHEAARTGKALVSGTTGIDAEGMRLLAEASKHAPILWSANMSVGVNLLAALVTQAARALDAGTDIEIVEMHHRHKVDAPSGTALLLGEAAADGRSVALKDVAVRSRDGHTGARAEGTIGFATLRGGDVVGEHTVVFASEGERVELTHKASNRDIFASGALRAALWLKNKPHGFYTMRDVLGL